MAARPEPLVSTTTPFDAPEDLLALLPAAGGTVWLRGGEGFVGWGEAARVSAGTGPERFRRAAASLAELFAGAEVDNQVGGWATGPIATGSFTFDPDAPGSGLVIPAVLVGRLAGRTWLTRTGWGRLPELAEVPAAAAPSPPAAPLAAAGQDHPALDEDTFREAVAAARDAIARGGLDKVVLSLRARVQAAGGAFDVRQVLRRLVAGYPECYTFAQGDMLGASPELLVRREGRAVRSVPLAGSARRGATPQEDARLGAGLLASTKDRWEHDLAVVTVVESLHPLCRNLRIDPEPSLLRLANVQHLATEVTGELLGEATALDIAGAVHPTAAVCGTPTRKALGIIRELEGANRGHYAGPVGWMDARGDGEWAIALRCAQVRGASALLYAGAGIVAASDPDAELEEARLKLRPVLSALDLTGS